MTTAEDDYALVMFGEIGAALEGTLGTQPSTQPVDGRSWFGRLPDSLALTATQRTAILSLRASFRQNNAAALDSLRTIFLKARDARRADLTEHHEGVVILGGGHGRGRGRLRASGEAEHEGDEGQVTEADHVKRSCWCGTSGRASSSHGYPVGRGPAILR